MMCLAIPSKVISIDEQTNMAVVDTMGVQRKASLDLLPEPVQVGDFVLIHIGYAVNIIDEEDAKESLKIFRELLDREEQSLGAPSV